MALSLYCNFNISVTRFALYLPKHPSHSHKRHTTSQYTFSIDPTLHINHTEDVIHPICRSYELMEQKLKVYIYREGEKPIFHRPLLRGIYASEGWFMKLIESNKRFVVRDPRKAHLFYLPFSSQMLRMNFMGSKKVQEKYLKNYVELIASKYRFWNRTGGADHFLVACHDWV